MATQPRSPVLIPLLLLVLLAPSGALARKPKQPSPAEGPRLPWRLDDPGRLLNVAQQHLARKDVDEAILVLHQAMEARPEEGYAVTILTQAQTFGLNQGPEAVAVYADLVERFPDEPRHAIWKIRAEVELHRNDRFTGPDTPWVAEALKILDGYTAEDQPVRTRYHAFLARRELLYRLRQHKGALAAGIAAYDLDPAPLQGRISKLLSAKHDKDLVTAEALCLDVIDTDPWAVEACATLWSSKVDASIIGPVRERILARVAELEPFAARDGVVANEVVKFYKRIKDHDRRRLFEAQVRKIDKQWKPVDHKNWWKGGFTIEPEFALLFRETNKTHRIEDAGARLAALLKLSVQAPAGATGVIVQRYRRAVLRAAKSQDPPAMDAWLQAGEELAASFPEDPRSWMELALLREQQGRMEDALSAVERELAARLADRWRPRDRRGAVTFRSWVERQRKALGEAHGRRARFLRSLGRDEQAYAAQTEAAWLSEQPQQWIALAEMAAERSDITLAREADIEGLSRLDKQGAAELPGPYKQSAADRFAIAHPQLAGAASPDAWSALLAAAQARRAERVDSEGGGESPRKETHPFVGREAPALEVTTLDGEHIKLSDLSDQVVIIDFWATWCAPCKKELPELEQAKRNLSGERVTFLLLSTDQTIDPVGPFIEQQGYSFKVAHVGDGAIKKQWRVGGIPSTFLIAPGGVVTAHHQGYHKGVGQRIEDEIRALLR